MEGTRRGRFIHNHILIGFKMSTIIHCFYNTLAILAAIFSVEHPNNQYALETICIGPFDLGRVKGWVKMLLHNWKS